MTSLQHHLRPVGLPPVNGYSHAVAGTGAIVAVSGQVPLDADGTLIGGPGPDGAPANPEAQLRQVFTNVGAALAAAGAGWADVAKLTVYLTDLADLPLFRTVRDEFVDTARPPACSLVQISALVHPDFRVEVDALAIVSG
ncbi:RidA family protein [Streptacidiphilus jiangxiensis]|uniref:Enamine deaminase RidA, house cleaning of reactive enamine intermediates, YjgF/YER057c/UK114 family n=1 Tax=Streptacidiphilus jiangxiensis TaxID=235985 RepID=A0A1H7FAQ9_STRJI|nr:RidA family protein [Streptacidiphilus jiangxiensis]SEK23058.1 Enamine deaminase RidA, house cleaning of reactive enamine intermediates, YjgF/YER057c/UK114 family [Streptacidiphilus jiangxiensis]